MEKKIIFRSILITLCSIIFFSGCVSEKDKIERHIKENLTQITNLDNKAVDEIITETKTSSDNVAYRKFIEESLTHLKYSISSVVQKGDTIVVTMDITTKNIDGLIEGFFQSIIEESTSAVFRGEALDKEVLYESAIQKMIVSYQNDVDKMMDVTTTLDMVYKKDADKQWQLMNEDEYYNVLLGGLFTKIDDYTQTQLKTKFLESIFHSLKEMTPEQAKNLFSGNSDVKVSTDPNLYIRYYNYMDTNILKEEPTDVPDESKFTIELKLLDAKKVFETFVDKYVDYYKGILVAQKSLSSEAEAHNIYQMMIDAQEENKDNKVVKKAELLIDSSLQIKNLNDFFSIILEDWVAESQKSRTVLQERLNRLTK